MLKPVSSILDCDTRFRDLVTVNAGGIRPMAITDLHAMIDPIQLSDAVPEEVRREFDTARNAFVYSWFVYEFTTLAELGGYTALDLALRQRTDPALLNTTKSPGLSRLLRTAIEMGYLARSDFEVPSPSGELACQLDFIPMLRNHVPHGNIHLLPQGALESMRLTYDYLGHMALCMMHPFPKWQNYALQNHRDLLEGLVRLGSWKAREMLGVSNEKIDPPDDDVVAARFFFGDVQMQRTLRAFYGGSWRPPEDCRWACCAGQEPDIQGFAAV
jgi:hypothetical protein